MKQQGYTGIGSWNTDIPKGGEFTQFLSLNDNFWGAITTTLQGVFEESLVALCKFDYIQNNYLKKIETYFLSFSVSNSLLCWIVPDNAAH